jgi:hypothetical protein
MTPGQQRKIQRAVHLGAALTVLVCVYLPLGDLALNVSRFLALPVLVLTGVVMWQAPRLRRLLARRPRAAATSSRSA